MFQTLLDEYGYVRVIESDLEFNFTIIELEGTIGMFLIKDNDLDLKRHFFLTRKDAHHIFDTLFEYYLQNSLSLSEYSEKYGL